VTHALAIEHATRAGFAVYDFMAGANRLKASFASHWTEMVWLEVRRPARQSALWSWLLSSGWSSGGQRVTRAAIGLNSWPDRTREPAADHVAADRS